MQCTSELAAAWLLCAVFNAALRYRRRSTSVRRRALLFALALAHHERLDRAILNLSRVARRSRGHTIPER
eukprot:6186799-Pleurochrysis_carterae.AAC.1